MIEKLLSEILAELKRHHAYCVERDKVLDAMDERDEEKRAENLEIIDTAIQRMNRLADKLER